jgi:hypothetical protein
MNIKEGFISTLKHPVILILPILLQVLISFGIGLILFFGIGLYSFGTLNYGASPSDFTIQFTLPLYIPLISDLNQSFTFLPIYEGDSIIWTIVTAIIYFVAVSFTMAMYLGRMKKVFVPDSLQRYSILRLGYRYFWRLFIYQLFTTILMLLSFYLLISTVIGGVIGFIILLLYGLTPYIIVLEEKGLGEALLDSPRYWRRYIKRFIPLALGAMLSTMALSLVIQSLSNESLQYYVGLISYTCLGTVFIAAFMNLLNTCIHDGDLVSEQEVELKYPKWKKWAIVVFIFVVPWFGIQFAHGKHVTALPFQSSKITFTEGVYYMADWSNAFSSSNRTFTTYGFEQRDIFELTMSLPESKSSAEEIYGEGKVTWKVDKESVTRNGNSTTYWGEEVVESSNFIYRLAPVYKNGTLYYTSNTEDGFAKLTNTGQSTEPMGIEIFVMNDGNDVFIYQYKKRFDPQAVIQISDNGKYFTPYASQVNPDDFKYFWYSKDPFTKERIVDFMRVRNRTDFAIDSDPNYYNFEILAAALLQQADGEGLLQLGEYFQQLGVQTNISSKTAEQWTEVLNSLYGEADLATFLEYFNKQNAYDSYEFIGWSDNNDRNEYQILVPFPNGEITLHCVREGELVTLEIALPE